MLKIVAHNIKNYSIFEIDMKQTSIYLKKKANDIDYYL